MRSLFTIVLTASVVFLMNGCGGDDDNGDQSGGGQISTHLMTIENEARSATNIIAVYLRSPDTDRYDPEAADWGQAHTVNIAPGGWQDILIGECDRHYDMQVEYAIKPENNNEYNDRGWLIFTYNIYLQCGEESTYTFQNID